MRIARLPVAAAFVAAAAGCASAKPEVYVAPSSDSIHSETEQSQGGSPAHLIYVVNQSSVPIVVFGIALRDCENIKQRCEPQTTNITVASGQKRQVLRVEPSSTARGYNYRFSFSWRPAKASQ